MPGSHIFNNLCIFFVYTPIHVYTFISCRQLVMPDDHSVGDDVFDDEGHYYGTGLGGAPASNKKKARPDVFQKSPTVHQTSPISHAKSPIFYGKSPIFF